MHTSTSYTLEVRPKIPARLSRLEELANNLWYSWDLPTRDLFSYINRDMWDQVGQNPKAFLRTVDEQSMVTASVDQVFLEHYHRTLAAYDAYHTKPVHNKHTEGLAENDLIAYFCAEFGFHESFPIYSGGHSARWSTCGDCHTDSSNYSTFTCFQCHPHSDPVQTASNHGGVPGYVYASQACYFCHPRGVVN